MRIASIIFAASLLLAGVAQADEMSKVEIQEWLVPWEDSRPRDPYVDPDGRVWFVGQRGDYVAYFTPTEEAFKKYELEPGAGPHTVVVSPDGIPWYAGNRAAHIGKIDPETGKIEKVQMPGAEARDPHTMAFDGRGHLWFTVQGGNSIGRLQPDTGKVDLVPVPQPGSRPYGIVVDSKGHPWIAEFGTNKLATVNPQSLELTEFELPNPNARPRRLEVSSKGEIWYVDYARGALGRFVPDTREFKEWEAPGGPGSRPYGMVIDKQDRIWFVETGTTPNRFVGFDPASEDYFAMGEIESGGGSVRHMYYDASKDSVWFGTDTNYLGRVQVE
jgi:virginiamycin B lyase